MSQELTARAQQVLKFLVERYIHDGQPVGSKTISQSSELQLSAASIRNVMADLEARGLVVAPHTSAGRVPTDRGYRLFVDSLLAVQPLDVGVITNIRSNLSSDLSSEQLLDSVSRLLSQISRQAGLVTLPRHDVVTLRQVEFLPLSEGRVLAILVCNGGEVQNRIMHLGKAINEAELKRAANYINTHCRGTTLGEIRTSLLSAMERDKRSISTLLESVVSLASQAFACDDDGDYVVAGESHLLAEAGTRDMARLRELFRAFEEKREILGVMERCMQAEGTQVFIGEESGFRVLDDYSVVTTPYQVAGKTVGVLGVIGPTRMDYEQVIPLVDITAKLLTTALSRR